MTLNVNDYYLLTPWSRVLLEKLIDSPLGENFPAFYGTWRFIAVFTCPYPEPDRWSPCPHPNFWISIYISSFHLRLVLPSGLFPSGFPFKTVYTPLLSLIPATCSAYIIILDLITQTILGEEYRSLTLRRLMSYIYGAPILDVSRSHTTTQHSR